VVVTFLAVMELIKESLLEIIQTEAFAPIHVKARTPSEGAFVDEQMVDEQMVGEQTVEEQMNDEILRSQKDDMSRDRNTHNE